MTKVIVKFSPSVSHHFPFKRGTFISDSCTAAVYRLSIQALTKKDSITSM